jgi:hypothetical protein
MICNVRMMFLHDGCACDVLSVHHVLQVHHGLVCEWQSDLIHVRPLSPIYLISFDTSFRGRVILYTSTGIEIVSCHQVQLREYILSVHRTHTHAHVHWH